jgi:hypothetical protein
MTLTKRYRVTSHNEPTSNLNALSRNLQNIKYEDDDQSAKKRATPYHIHVLPLLNGRCWKQLIFKNVCICNMFVQCYRAHYVIKVLILWS